MFHSINSKQNKLTLNIKSKILTFMVIGSNKKKVYQEFWIRLYQNTANKA